MRSKLAAAAVGALAGVSVAGAVQLAYEFFRYLPPTGALTLSPAPSPIDVLFTLAFAAGPGAFVLGFVLAILLRACVERGASRGRVLALGALGGLPAGMINLVALMIILGADRKIPTLLVTPHGRMIAAEALAGGLALGLACAWSLTRRPREGVG